MLSFAQGGFAVSRPCPRCLGRGKIISTPCSQCGGRGQTFAQKRILLNIPASINDGTQLRLQGQGQPGSGGGPSGDLIVKVNVGRHRFFERKGKDVYCKIPINIAQATLGSKIRVRTIDGRVDLRIPPGTQSGTKFRLRGRGVEINGSRGDQYVEVLVDIPKKMSEEQRRLMEKFAKEGGLKY
jgi:molecular chaperone DnaJ